MGEGPYGSARATLFVSKRQVEARSAVAVSSTERFESLRASIVITNGPNSSVGRPLTMAMIKFAGITIGYNDRGEHIDLVKMF